VSVARDGYPYVRYSGQTVYAIELETMDCSETTYDASFGSFRMGYATAHASTWQDKLYVANATQLAQLDTETWELTSLGAVPSQPVRAHGQCLLKTPVWMWWVPGSRPAPQASNLATLRLSKMPLSAAPLE